MWGAAGIMRWIRLHLSAVVSLMRKRLAAEDVLVVVEQEQ